MEPRIAIFTDLDDTLIQTEAKVPENVNTTLGATDREGNALSFFTSPQLAMINLFAKNAIVIPVTGRNTDALNRVQYAFDSYKVVSHGAVVLRDNGNLCPDWLSEINDELNEWPQLLEQSNLEIQKIIKCYDLDARSRVIVDQDIPAYVSVKGQGPALQKIQQENSLDSLFYRHENGRNHALLPPYSRKKRAVEFIKLQLGLQDNDLTIGIGDSLSDLAFMNACQFSMMPSNSQIVKEGRYCA